MNEPAQIGLNEGVHTKLDRLVEQGHFEEMRDGYRFAVSYALAMGVDPEKLDGTRKTVFSISTLDPNGHLKVAVDALSPNENEPTYRIVERLADWGISEIARLIEDEYVGVADILRSVISEE